jgi:hypothetical protein
MSEFSKPGYLLKAGIPLTMTSSITVKAMSEDKEVKTLLLGLAGFSDGAQMVEISAKSAIPLAGYEYDVIGICLSHQTQELSFRLANIIMTVRGRIVESSAETSVDNPNGLDFTFRGAVVARSTA